MTEKQGIAWVPGTFPTRQFTKYVNEITADISEKEYTNDTTDTIYFAYKDYVLDGNKPFRIEKESWTEPYPGIQYIQEKTGFKADYIFQWLYALDLAVYTDKIVDTQYILIEQSESAFSPFKDLKAFMEKYQRRVIVISVVGLAGVGLYFGWPYLSAARKGYIAKHKKK